MFHILLRASGDEYQVQSYKQGQHAEMILQELTPAEYSEEKLRYLVHSTMPDGVRFLLVFLKRKKVWKGSTGQNFAKLYLGTCLIQPSETSSFIGST